MGQDVPAQPRWGARLPAAPRGSGPALRTPRGPSLPAELLRPDRRGPPQFPAPDLHPYWTGPAASESARAAKNAWVNQKRPELRTRLNAVAFRPAGTSNTGDPSAVRPKLRPRPPDVSHTGRGVRAGSRSRAQGVPEPRPHWLHPSPAPADPRVRRALLAHRDLSRPWPTATSLCQRRSGPRADRGDARGLKDEETKRFPTWVGGYAPVSPQRRVRAHTLTRIGTRTRARALTAFPSATPRSARARTSCALPGGGPPQAAHGPVLQVRGEAQGEGPGRACGPLFLALPEAGSSSPWGRPALPLPSPAAGAGAVGARPAANRPWGHLGSKVGVSSPFPPPSGGPSSTEVARDAG